MVPNSGIRSSPLTPPANRGSPGGSPRGTDVSILFEHWKTTPCSRKTNGSGVVLPGSPAHMSESQADARLSVVREKVVAGQRLSFDDGLFLAESADLFTLGELANLVPEGKHGRFTYYNV